MKKNIINTKYLWLLFILIGLTACNDVDDILADNNAEILIDEPLPELTSGSADFSKFVSVGNSLTAGFTDNALFIAGQVNSLPNILSQKFAIAGGGSFIQPLMNDNIGGMVAFGNVVLGPRYYFFIDTDPSDDYDSGPYPLGINPPTDFIPETPTTDATVNIFNQGPYNNMGIPGAKAVHLLYDGYAALNPYFGRMASAPNATVLGDAIAQNPTFFSLWPGENDVLGYALSGGDGSDPITPSIGPPGVGFDETYGALVATLTSGGAQGVVANIPDVTTIPHFTTVPYNPLDPSNPAFGPQIPTLNMIFGALNQVFSAYGETDRLIVFSETEASAVIIKDESLADFSAQIAGALGPNPNFAALLGQFGLPPEAAPQVAGLLGFIYGQARQATATDLLVLPSSSVIGTVNMDNLEFLMSQGLSQALAGQFSVEGVSLPLADKWVLLPSEQQEIKDATDAFNATIQATASQAGLAFVDANSLLQQLFAGNLSSGDFTPNSDLVFGGVFSLDGVHPTARGYALIANEFMRAIDTNYGSNFEASGNFVDIGDYPTNYPPALQ